MKFKPYEEYKEVDLPWLDRLPSHWEIDRGKQVFRNRKELNINYQCNNILSLTLKGVINNDINNPVGLVPKDYATYQIFEKDDLVFKLIDLENFNTSRVGLIHEKGIMSPAYIRLEQTRKDNIRYFYYQYYDLYLRKVYNNLGAGVRSTLSSKDLINFKIAIPPKEEQDKIVEFLDYQLEKIDRFIDLRERQIALFEEEKEVLINDAVTKGINKNVEYKDSGIDWIGEIPEHWEVIRLKYLVDSNLYSLSNNECKDIEIEYIDIGSVGFFKLKSNPVKMSFGEAPSRARRIVSEGDIIISTVRTYLKSMLYIDKSLSGKIVSTGFSVLTPKNDINSNYLKYAISGNYLIQNIIKSSIGVAYPAINDDRLMSLEIIYCGDKDEQKSIVVHIEKETSKIDQTIDLYKKQIDLIKEYRTSLISHAVTGKIDVRDFQEVK